MTGLRAFSSFVSILDSPPSQILEVTPAPTAQDSLSPPLSPHLSHQTLFLPVLDLNQPKYPSHRPFFYFRRKWGLMSITARSILHSVFAFEAQNCTCVVHLSVTRYVGGSTHKHTSSLVNPKTETCWFWATPNKDCFTADECRMGKRLIFYLETKSSYTSSVAALVHRMVMKAQDSLYDQNKTYCIRKTRFIFESAVLIHCRSPFVFRVEDFAEADAIRVSVHVLMSNLCVPNPSWPIIGRA
jgi:hypothetical protein